MEELGAVDYSKLRDRRPGQCSAGVKSSIVACSTNPWRRRRSAAACAYDNADHSDAGRWLVYNTTDGALNMLDVKLQDVKQTDEISRHEIAGHENAKLNVLAYITQR